MSRLFSQHLGARRETPIAVKVLRIVVAILVVSLCSAPRATAGEDPLPEGWDIKHRYNPPTPTPPPEPEWQLVWSDDFDDGTIEDWSCDAFTPHDVIELVADGNGYCLHAASKDGDRSCGFVVESPDLALQGLDFTKIYRIDFRFRIPDACNVGACILRTQAATFVLGEVNPVSGVAKLGWTDQSLQPHWLGQMRLGVWHSLRISVFPILERPTWSLFKVFLDGRDLGFWEAPRASWRSVSIFHPPFEIAELRLPDDPLDGGGFWDDFAVYTRNGPPIRGGTKKIVPTVVPNPANPSTTIHFDLPDESFVTVDVFTVDGRHVVCLWDGRMSAGPQSFTWYGTDASGNSVSSGIYYGLVSTPEAAYPVRITILK